MGEGGDGGDGGVVGGGEGPGAIGDRHRDGYPGVVEMSVMASAQPDEVVQVGPAAVRPVDYVVGVGPQAVGTAGELTAWIAGVEGATEPAGDGAVAPPHPDRLATVTVEVVAQAAVTGDAA